MSKAWELSNDIESISCRICNVRDVLELIAVDIVSEPTSGATWAARDMLESIIQELDKQAQNAMELHKELSNVEATPKKAKKKKEFDMDGRC